MSPFSKLSIALKALNQLGYRPLALNAVYRLGLAAGHYRRVENREWRTEISASSFEIRKLFSFPSQEELLEILGQEAKEQLLAEADDIVSGKVRLFGGSPVPLQLAPEQPLKHWTVYESGKAPLTINNADNASINQPRPPHFSDIKFLWEPARFGWAFTLGRAYHLTHDDKFAQAFWQYFEAFDAANPAYLGPNWTSGQEAASRLMVFSWAAQAFAAAPDSTPERLKCLGQSIAIHAARIPPTLVYARSQQNNHLLTEAAGLLTAGLALPDHPKSSRWRALGWKWLNHGLQEQIDGYGEYAQHSCNYQRLMLQVVLWVNSIIRNDDLSRHYAWPRQTTEAIKRSVHWLLSLLDVKTGCVPNLGANDGAYLFPMTISPFTDFRPVLHAAARAFLDYDLPRGRWDELTLWFGIPLENRRYVQLPRYLGDHLYGKDSWAYLRTAQFATRPSHADQLHVDLWWHGLNVAQDAGTYRYNADPPWDNGLTTALVHNTVTVDGRDQMTRAGRFLYLDWVNAYRRSTLDGTANIIQQASGRYHNYRQGYRHTRTVIVFTGDRWRIEDELLPLPRPFSPLAQRPRSFRLHWLLPDWEWELEKRHPQFGLRLKTPGGWMVVRIGYKTPASKFEPRISLARAGEILIGSATPDPIRGWVSPTYGVKMPALSLVVETESTNDVQFVSEFTFP